MLIDRIYLRNYRVFEDELELVLPPGSSEFTGLTALASPPFSSPSCGRFGVKPARRKRRCLLLAPTGSAWPKSHSSTRATSTSCAARSPGPTRAYGPNAL